MHVLVILRRERRRCAEAPVSRRPGSWRGDVISQGERIAGGEGLPRGQQGASGPSGKSS